MHAVVLKSSHAYNRLALIRLNFCGSLNTHAWYVMETS